MLLLFIYVIDDVSLGCSFFCSSSLGLKQALWAWGGGSHGSCSSWLHSISSAFYLWGVLDGRASPISPPEIAELCFRWVQDPVSSPVSLLPLPHGWMALFLLYLLHWSTFAWDWGGGFCPSPGRSGLCLIVDVKWSGCLGTTKRGGSPGFSPWPSCFLVTSPVENHGKELVSDYGHPLCLGSLRFYTVILTHTQF